MPNRSILIGTAEFFARIFGLYYTVSPKIAVGIVRQKIVYCGVLVSIPVLIYPDYALSIISLLSGNGRSHCRQEGERSYKRLFHFLMITLVLMSVSEVTMYIPLCEPKSNTYLSESTSKDVILRPATSKISNL